MSPLPFLLLFQKGISLGLFHEDPDFSYAPLLAEIAAAGADHVEIVVSLYQRDVRATDVHAHPRFTVRDEVLARAIRQARAAGLHVMVFPILRLLRAATPDEWRGTLAPRDPDAWWRGYRAAIVRLAAIAQKNGAAIFSIGSEMNSLDGDHARWAELAREVRAVFRGRLIYSANWDRFARVGLWDVVDLAGLSAYFEIGGGDRDPGVEALVRAWREARVEALRARKKIGKPLVITEVGYRSQDAAASRPWDEEGDSPLDLEEQRRCYEAFARVWAGAPDLAGVYFWTWYGWGGPRSREYTPRGKPAAGEICRFFGAKACPRAWGADWLPR